jgi:threonine synthase
MGTVTHLECSICRQQFAARKPHNLCSCGGPLLVRYDLAEIRSSCRRDSLQGSTMWRYAAVLPVESESNRISLGEGWTPLLRTEEHAWVKDEGLNPTGSFKARGLSCAVSMCKELGVQTIALPSAGNAGGAAAAYAAAAGIQSHVFMPADVPHANYIEASAYGSRVTLIDGLISDCGRMVAELAPKHGWFEVSTLKEPYRIEGKKTMGYELAEQFGWELPDAVIYPAGGGVGLIGMWKAFAEMEKLGWIGSQRPKMIAVQAEGCQPVVRAWETGANASEFYANASTVASGLRVPKPLGDRLMIEAMRESGGCAIAVNDREMMDSALELSRHHGVFAAPEGGASLAAYRRLRASGFLKREDRTVLFNTGTGTKYLEAFSVRYPRCVETESAKLGGLITPR